MEGLEKLISFFSHALMDVELKYNLVKKQPYALVKALNSFWILLKSDKKSYILTLQCSPP